MASTDNSIALVKRYFNEILNQGKLSVIDEIIAPNFILKVPSLHEPFRGHEGMKQFIIDLRSAFPDICFTIERHIVEGDKVACRFTSASTHLGTFQGLPPTGNHIEDQGVNIFNINNGKITAVWVNENAFGVMQQLGILS